MSLAGEVPVARRALTVRSTILSVLLGAHPETIPASKLTRAAAYFDFPPTAVRVALSRAVAAGDVRRTEAGYVLGDRLLERQHRQAEAVAAISTPWAGEWEHVVVVTAGRSGRDRASLRTLLAGQRLGELREGVWLRPANLIRTPEYANREDLIVVSSRCDDSKWLAQRLWNLDAWAMAARRLRDELAETDGVAARLVVAAELVRHLSTDPILPAEILPVGWPGDDLRASYAAFQNEIRDLSRSL